MPTYEYECTKGHQFEEVQRITEEPLVRCKICRAKVRRLISASTFILKGGGWYSDGYSARSGDTKSDAESSKDSTKSGDASSKSATASGDKKSKGTSADSSTGSSKSPSKSSAGSAKGDS